jgi:hypothetical protein
MSHRFVDDDGSVDGPLGAGFEVRHVQPYQAVKTYRCPGCDHEIRPGEGHEVVVPRDAPQDRRHWHSSCWQRASRPKGAKRAAKATAQARKRARRKR